MGSMASRSHLHRPISPYLASRRRDGSVGPSNHDGKEDQLMPFFQKMEKVI
jgi:hypothetical protein